LPALARQMFRYGYWRRFTRALHPHRVPLRVYAPPALVGALLASIACAAVGWYSIAAAVPLAYASYVAAAMLAALPQLGVRCTTWLPAVLPCMHLAYGAGFWRALFSPRLGVVDSSAPRRRAGRSAAH
jgi:hypothetical protein